MHFLHTVFPEALAAFEARLRQAWTASGLDPGALAPVGALPRITFGSWVGGDRDGHPGVTGAVTADTLARHREAALVILDGSLEALAGKLSLSLRRQPAPRVPSRGDRGAQGCPR
jgi:phosphoenolpyruvate carboxylase